MLPRMLQKPPKAKRWHGVSFERPRGIEPLSSESIEQKKERHVSAALFDFSPNCLELLNSRLVACRTGL